LHNRKFTVHVLLSKPVGVLQGAAKAQLNILLHAGLLPAAHTDAVQVIQDATLVIDALIGYSLRSAPTGETATLIQLCNRHASRLLSLDVPSRVDTKSGESPGIALIPERTLTLALPKTGLAKIEGDLFVADIGIPPEVYAALGITFEPFFKDRYWLPLFSIDQP
jgi:NAD(P)H-hydrate epimerase